MKATDPTRPVPLDSVLDWHATTDVLIAGAGGAGTSAAIEALDAGAEVMLLEAASAGGGSTALSGGLIYMGGGTPVQHSCGFEDSTEAMYQYLLAASGPDADQAKIKLYCDESLQHFDWLIAQGVEFKHEYYAEKHTNTPNEAALMMTGNEDAWPDRNLAAPAPRGHKPRIKGDHGGIPLMKALLASAIAKGVDLVCDARVLNSIVDAQGRVCGAVVRIDGQQRCIRARRGVVLCCGGFIMNREMVEHYAPRLALGNYPNGNPFDTGGGIKVGEAAGGALVNMHEGFICTPFYPPSEFLQAVIIDDSGERFINEDVYHGRMGSAILDRPERRYYLIIDSRHFEVLDRAPLGGYPVAAVEESATELEVALRLPEGSFSGMLRSYNEHAAAGADPQFHKHERFLVPLDRPPYAAYELTLGQGGFFAVMTFGGLDTLPSGEVLNGDGQVIAGLFAAGRNSAGVPRSAQGYASGMSVGDATFFGRKAGYACATAVVPAHL